MTIVLHPAGNVAEHLLANGLARIVEWHAGMLAGGGGMERFRAAEKSSKEKRLNLFASQPMASSSSNGDGAASNALGGRTFEGTVLRIWSGDQVSVVAKDGVNERRLQFSSTRGPKCGDTYVLRTQLMLILNRLADPRQAAYAQEAREFLRKKLVGKHVKVHIDFVRPREGELEERECVTIRYGGHNA